MFYLQPQITKSIIHVLVELVVLYVIFFFLLSVLFCLICEENTGKIEP